MFTDSSDAAVLLTALVEFTVLLPAVYVGFSHQMYLLGIHVQ